MTTKTCIRDWRLGFTALLLLVSCSSTPAGGNDTESEADGFDSFDDAADAGDVVTDGVVDAGDATGDATSDAFVCGDVPKEGCPCNELTDEPCCLELAKGLSCEAELINGSLVPIWGVFWDCGCDGSPSCGGYEVYGLCDGVY